MALGLSKTVKSSVALIDITSSSVGGALAHFSSGAQPTIYYTNRLLIEQHGDENLSAAMLRTLGELADKLVTEGAPVLHQETKSGHIDRVFASIGTPWQATSVRTEHINDTKPFTFTKAFLTDITRKSSAVKEGYVLSGESVIATLLNGYEVSRPFGKKATRAEIVVLSSLIEKETAQQVESTLRKTYHTHALTLTAFAPIAYTVFRDLFPHEKDFLVLDVSGEATDIAFIKRGLLVDVSSAPHGVNELARSAHVAAKTSARPTGSTSMDIMPNERFGKEIESARKAWLDTLTATLRDFSTRNALPRTLFLLAEDDSRDYLKNLLDSPDLRSLWLTDEPLAIIPVMPSQFSAFIKSRAEANGDVYLALLTLFAGRQERGEAV